MFYFSISIYFHSIQSIISIFLLRYGGKDSDKLTSLRHIGWYKAKMGKNKQLEPVSLPLTEGATYFHSFRVHFGIIKASKLDIDCGLDPCYWVWQRLEVWVATTSKRKELAIWSISTMMEIFLKNSLNCDDISIFSCCNFILFYLFLSIVELFTTSYLS